MAGNALANRFHDSLASATIILQLETWMSPESMETLFGGRPV
jgi:hypothetical protein